MSFRLDPDKPHRRASNSCRALQTDMVQCYQRSKCYESGQFTFDQCLHNADPELVGEMCIMLRKSYGQCRRNLLNGNMRMRGNSLSS